MKRIALILIIAVIAVAIACKKEEKKMAREGIVNFVTGTVTIIDQGKRTTAKVGDVVREGMKIETGDKASIDIYFDADAVRILEKSTVEIKTLQMNLTANTQDTNIRVEDGKVFARISRKLAKGDNYKINSNTTTAAIRGTEFLVEENKAKGTGMVACLDGKVEVKSELNPDEKPVDIDGGQQVEIMKDKPLTVTDLSEENRRNLENIRRTFQDQREDIRKRFEEQREQIRKALQDQKDANREMIERRKAEDKENVERQKEGDKANVDALRTGADTEGRDRAMDEAQRQREANRSSLQDVKPDIKKFKSDLK